MLMVNKPVTLELEMKLRNVAIRVVTPGAVIQRY
jgi:hypothetical protein